MVLGKKQNEKLLERGRYKKRGRSGVNSENLQFDYAESTYAEGYARMQTAVLLTTGNLYFVKKPEHGLQPFFLVVNHHMLLIIP